MRLKSGPWGLAAGIVLGFVIGSTSVAVAAFGYKGWQRFGRDFQVGYLAGFFDMANLARNITPGGFIDERYPLWPKATLADWHDAVNEVYENPDNQGYGMYEIVQLAAVELKKKYGPAPTAVERLAPILNEQLKRARQGVNAAKAKAESQMPAVTGTSAATGAAVAAAPPKLPAEPPASPWAHKKRRCCACPDAAKDSAGEEKAGADSAAVAAKREPAKADAAKPQAAKLDASRRQPVKPDAVKPAAAPVKGAGSSPSKP